MAAHYSTDMVKQEQGDKSLTLITTANPQYSWMRSWMGNQNDEGRDVVVASDGSIYCVGLTDTFGAGNDDLLLVKFFSNGTEAWNVTWGGGSDDAGEGIALDSTGAIYCVGYSLSYTVGSADIALVKFFPNGTKAWHATWGTSGYDQGLAVTVGVDGFIYCTGYIYESTEDLILIKCDSNGNQIWNTTWGYASGHDRGTGVAISDDGFIYCVGESSAAATSEDLLLVKFYPNGTQSWNSTWDISGTQHGHDLVIGSDDAIYCTGYKEDITPSSEDIILVKFDANGNITWANIYGDGTTEEIAYGIVVDTNDFIYCSGYIQAMSYDFLLCQFYPNGTQLWNTSWDAIGDEDYGFGMAIHDNAIYMVGYNGSGLNDLELLKYLPPLPEQPTLQPILPNPDEDGNISLSWDHSLYAATYDVYRSTTNITSISGLIPLATTADTIYSDINVANGKYYYVIVAKNAAGSSNLSNCQSITVKRPTNPGLLWLLLIFPAIVIGVVIYYKRREIFS